MKKFFSEFKTFITRGNVVDMAVGVIVGGAFTAIVNGLSNFILKPIINWILALILGENSLDKVYTMLITAYKDIVDDAGAVIGQEIDLAKSIYIDWGSFINAIINFLLIALVLFCIVKVINKMRENSDKLKKSKPTKEEAAEMKALGIKLRDKKAVEAYYADKAAKAAAAAEEAKRDEEEKARLDREANPTTEDLLKKILAAIENK